ncbi:uncharacterized protein MONOS_6734 [Monocercomonoides exilis]|uniref:uncharacterized protein n=1 Tax=Monocercomonoides exilis TaxID=2049356 RepID=UPI00355A2233|nr:hypothetical protein MONOS_6734 [Monocercomonoides exilis]|eukprot:MONOS_6734.1-p1 / transcript=MONOS_6734.1 / gene=MONOS_6734 / organism=Monocercomonoides_exilis_PA203 / gene_product=unspecified product / transcript_product=unspecified product / location=Mono_scaffold00217:72802-75428(+) / protein_length=852 / sequence_SO=supercontig / SO=protein_coding / is_pseudo=false
MSYLILPTERSVENFVPQESHFSSETDFNHNPRYTAFNTEIGNKRGKEIACRAEARFSVNEQNSTFGVDLSSRAADEKLSTIDGRPVGRTVETRKYIQVPSGIASSFPFCFSPSACNYSTHLSADRAPDGIYLESIDASAHQVDLENLILAQDQEIKNEELVTEQIKDFLEFKNPFQQESKDILRIKTTPNTDTEKGNIFENEIQKRMGKMENEIFPLIFCVRSEMLLESAELLKQRAKECKERKCEKDDDLRTKQETKSLNRKRVENLTEGRGEWEKEKYSKVGRSYDMQKKTEFHEFEKNMKQGNENHTKRNYLLDHESMNETGNELDKHTESSITHWRPPMLVRQCVTFDGKLAVDGDIVTSANEYRKEQMIYHWRERDFELQIKKGGKYMQLSCAMEANRGETEKEGENKAPAGAPSGNIGMNKEEREREKRKRRNAIKEEIKEAKQHEKVFGEWVRKRWIVDEEEEKMWDEAEAKVRRKREKAEMKDETENRKAHTEEELKNKLQEARERIMLFEGKCTEKEENGDAKSEEYGKEGGEKILEDRCVPLNDDNAGKWKEKNFEDIEAIMKEMKRKEMMMEKWQIQAEKSDMEKEYMSRKMNFERKVGKHFRDVEEMKAFLSEMDKEEKQKGIEGEVIEFSMEWNLGVGLPKDSEESNNKEQLELMGKELGCSSIFEEYKVMDGIPLEQKIRFVGSGCFLEKRSGCFMKGKRSVHPLKEGKSLFDDIDKVVYLKQDESCDSEREANNVCHQRRNEHCLCEKEKFWNFKERSEIAVGDVVVIKLVSDSELWKSEANKSGIKKKKREALKLMIRYRWERMLMKTPNRRQYLWTFDGESTIHHICKYKKRC